MHTHKRQRTVLVCCASSSLIAPFYQDNAYALGVALGNNGYTLVYGGETLGLMEKVALGVLASGGNIISVTHKEKTQNNPLLEMASYVIFVESLQERKTIMEQLANAYVVMPGGLGTLDELFEYLALKDTKANTKPLIMLDWDGYFKGLIDWLYACVKKGFIKASSLNCMPIVKTTPEVIATLDRHLLL